MGKFYKITGDDLFEVKSKLHAYKEWLDRMANNPTTAMVFTSLYEKEVDSITELMNRLGTDGEVFVKAVGQRYEVVNGSNWFATGETVTLFEIFEDKISRYINEQGHKGYLYDIDHSKCEVKYIDEGEQKNI